MSPSAAGIPFNALSMTNITTPQEMTKAGAESVEDISATRLSRGDPWAFRPILANGLVLSCIHIFRQPSHFIHFTPKRKRSIREVRIEPLQELQDRKVPPLG